MNDFSELRAAAKELLIDIESLSKFSNAAESDPDFRPGLVALLNEIRAALGKLLMCIVNRR